MGLSYEEQYQARLRYMRANKSPRRPPESRRAYELIRTGIRTGAIGPGARLDEEYLIATLYLTRSAVREALDMLSGEGLIQRVRKVGTRVVRPLVEIDLDSGSVTGGADLAERRMSRGVASVRDAVELDESLKGAVVEEIMLFEVGEPIAWWLMAQVPTRAEANCRSVRVETIAATEELSELFGVAVRAPLLTREHVDFDVGGHRSAVGYLIARGDRVMFRSRDVSD